MMRKSVLKSLKKYIVVGVIFISLLTVSTLGLVGCSDASAEECDEVLYLGENKDIKALEKQAGKDFKIMLFTDLQLWANLFDNKKTYEMMDALVEEERPDLIILPGDNVSGLATKSLLKKLISKMESYEIPWAPTYGNHDMEGVASIQWQSKRYESAKYCLFERGEEDLYGMGNYSISISENGEIVYTLMFMDNGRYIKYEDGSKREIYISEEQTEWYEREMKKISSYNKKQTPSMLFSHFAMPEMRTAIENLSEIGEDGYFYVPNEQGSGYCKYLPCAAPVNKGFIDRAKNVGLTHVFCGHDHENNASVFYQGITYTYGLKTGCSPRYWNDADSYGATVITIGENINFYNNVKWTAK